MSIICRLCHGFCFVVWDKGCPDCGGSLEEVAPSARALWNTRAALAATQPAAPAAEDDEPKT